MVTQELLAVMEDADGNFLVTQPEFAQTYIDHFFQDFASGAIEQHLTEYQLLLELI